MTAWRVLTSRRLLERRWLTVHEQRVRLPTGAEIEEFHLLESPDWVGVIPTTEGGKLVLVAQYRHGAQQLSLELPAGVVDAGETPLEAARRELAEETGFEAERFTPLSTVFPEPARHSNRAHFFVASGAVCRSAPRLDESEHLVVRVLSLAEVLEAIDSGALFHGSHVGAILLALRRGLL